MGEYVWLPTPGLADLTGMLLPAAGIVGYLCLMARIGKGNWPLLRCGFWIAGNACAALSVTGPVPQFGGGQYVADMVRHVLIGMLAPLLLAQGAPVTLLLRALPATTARRLVRFLNSRPVRFVTRPIIAAALNIGGLWLLYATPLYPALDDHPLLHVLVHAHVFLAGYLLTISVVSTDPMRHRASHRHRAVVLVAAFAAHDILAKYLYAHPPAGIAGPAAQTGAIVMYYGGDAVDMLLLVLLAARWYRTSRPRTEVHKRRATAQLAQ